MKYVWLALFIVACTLVPFLLVWPAQGLRAAAHAWRQFAAWIAIVLIVGGVVLVLMPLPLPR